MLSNFDNIFSFHFCIDRKVPIKNIYCIQIVYIRDYYTIYRQFVGFFLDIRERGQYNNNIHAHACWANFT